MGVIKTTQESFKVETVTNLKYKLTPSINNINFINFEEIDEDVFNILTDMEDKTYWKRGDRYTFISSYFFKRKIKKVLKSIKNKNVGKYINKVNIYRGFSTLEMQLIRTIGIVYGYGSLTYQGRKMSNMIQWGKIIRRKIYELIYATIFFNSLKKYYEKNVYANADKYKKYLLWIYLSWAPTRINKNKYENIFDFLGKDPKNWTKEKCFIAYAGLPYVGSKQGLNKKDIKQTYAQIIKDYELDSSEINEILDEQDRYFMSY